MKNVYGKELGNFTRLTRHYQDWEVENAKPNKDYITTDYFCPRRDVSYDDCLNKLGQLEDIEQELGIDLPTLIKAMKDGVYVIDVYGSIVFEEPMICFNQELKTNLYVLDSVCNMPPDNLCKSTNYYLKDYGKTWALTRGELEK